MRLKWSCGEGPTTRLPTKVFKVIVITDSYETTITILFKYFGGENVM